MSCRGIPHALSAFAQALERPRTGCAGLKLQLVDASVRQALQRRGLLHRRHAAAASRSPTWRPTSFHIYEDGQPVSVLESKQTILQPEVAAIHYTLLLVDMSGSVVDSGDMPALIQAAASFADRVGPYQKVAIYTFDGSPHLTPIVGLRRQRAQRHPRAGHAPAQDPSTNLNGAVIEGVNVAHHQMERAPVPLRFGTLVVFTDGTDRAHRAAPDDVTRALDSAGFETYVIGVGQEVDKRQLSRIGRSGTFASHNPTDIRKGFDEVAPASRPRRGAITCCRIARRRARASTRSRSRR